MFACVVLLGFIAFFAFPYFTLLVYSASTLVTSLYVSLVPDHDSEVEPVDPEVTQSVPQFLRLGYRFIRYLHDWLVLASSLEEILQARDALLNLCSFLNIQINHEKSHLIPTQESSYLGIRIDSRIFRAFPVQKRLTDLFSLLEEFLASQALEKSPRPYVLPFSSGSGLSFKNEVPSRGSKPLGLRRPNILVLALSEGSSVVVRSKQSDPRSITGGPSARPFFVYQRLKSRLGRGSWKHKRFGSLASSNSGPIINFKELMAVELAIKQFLPHLRGQKVALFSDNSTTISYLKEAGGTRSLSLNQIAQRICRTCEEERESPSSSSVCCGQGKCHTKSRAQSGLFIKRFF